MRPNLDGPMTKAFMAQGQPVVANNRAEMAAWGMRADAGHRAASLSTALVPIMPATASSARIALDDHERENAFGEAEVRLLRPWPPAWAWRWRTRATSTRRSAC